MVRWSNYSNQSFYFFCCIAKNCKILKILKFLVVHSYSLLSFIFMVRSKSWPSRFLDCHCTSNRKLAFSLMPTKRPLRVSIAMMQRNSENRREEREHESRSRPQKRGEKEVARGASPMWEKSIIILSQKNLDLGLLQTGKRIRKSLIIFTSFLKLSMTFLSKNHWLKKLPYFWLKNRFISQKRKGYSERELNNSICVHTSRKMCEKFLRSCQAK